MNHYAFTRYFSDEILWSREVNFDHLYSVVLITLFVALLQALVLFPCRLCSKHIASMFFTISYKRRNVWEKNRAKLLPQKKKSCRQVGLKKKNNNNNNNNAPKIFHHPPAISNGLSLRIVKNTSDTHVLTRWPIKASLKLWEFSRFNKKIGKRIAMNDDDK